MRWRVHYVDGTTFDSRQGNPEDAPGGGVAAIVQEDDRVGVVPHRGNDFYCYDEARWGGWYGLDYFGLAQYLVDPGSKVIKLGEAMPTDRYADLLAALREDPWMPEKSARYPWECPTP